MKTTKATIVIALFCLCMLVSTVGLAFAQTENWVEVATFSEGRARFGDTNSFVIDHEEWRLVWEYQVDLELLTAFMFDVKVFETQEIIGGYNNSGKLDITQGIYNITGQTGEFYLFIGSNGLSYSITIEQNVDSVPEFGSWIIVPVALGTVLFVVAYKKRHLHL